MESPDFFAGGVPGKTSKRPDNIEELMEKTKTEEGEMAAELSKSLTPSKKRAA